MSFNTIWRAIKPTPNIPDEFSFALLAFEWIRDVIPAEGGWCKELGDDPNDIERMKNVVSRYIHHACEDKCGKVLPEKAELYVILNTWILGSVIPAVEFQLGLATVKTVLD